MTRNLSTPAVGIAIALAAASQAQCQAPTQAQTQLPPAAPAAPAPAAAALSSVTPPAPAVKAGQAVLDSGGQRVGAIQTLVETPAGPMVVVQIDGKLVSLPQTTLRMQGETITSTQTKDQMLNAASAPR